MEKNKLIFQYQDLPAGYRAVALNSKLEDYQQKCLIINGEPKVVIPDMVIKDCRKLDGCLYVAPKGTKETELNEMIELFNKALLEKKGWTRNQKA